MTPQGGEDRHHREADTGHRTGAKHAAEQLDPLAHLGDAPSGRRPGERGEVVILRVGALLGLLVGIEAVTSRLGPHPVVVDEHLEPLGRPG